MSMFTTPSKTLPLTAFLSYAIVAVVISLVGCSSDNAPAGAAPGSASPASVARPLVQPVAVTHSYPAEVEAVERVELRPRVGGYVEELTFQEGSYVTRGQLLYRIDAREYRAAVAEAEAALAQAKADAEAAEHEAHRSSRLVEKKAISEEDADRRQTTAAARIARVEAARAALSRAKLNLSFTEVRSPINGRIGRAEVTAGNLVTPQTRLAVIVATDSLYVRFDIDETSYANAPSNLKAWNVAFTTPGSTEPLPARVAYLDNEVGRGTGTIRVRARLQSNGGKAMPGMYGTAALQTSKANEALLIREEAIGSDQGRRFVLAVGPDNKLQYRPVTLGTRVGNLRVITEGLSANDRVVVNGLFRLRPGAEVTPQETSMQTAGNTASKNTSKES